MERAVASAPCLLKFASRATSGWYVSHIDVWI